MTLKDDVLKSRYLQKNESGEVTETVHDMYRRVAEAVGSDDKEYVEDFYTLMCSGKFLPNSPTLMNAGTQNQMLSACFVLPISDNMDSILKANTDAVRIQKAGGGVGFGFSNIRPKNDYVLTTNGVASGPVSFMRAINGWCEEVKQGGRRRGANMGCLRVDHPDIRDFLTCKDVEGTISAFNISVAVTDKFMEALEHDDVYDLKFEDKVYRSEKASEIWGMLCKKAWKTGDPGLLFIDRINKHDPVDNGVPIETSNPCFSGNDVLLVQNNDYGVLVPVDAIEVGMKVWSCEGWSEVTRKVCSGKKPVYRYMTHSGYIDLTQNHRVMCDGNKEYVSNATHLEQIVDSPELESTIEMIPEYIMSGLLLGDGWVKRGRRRPNNDVIEYMLLCIGEKDQDYFDSEVSHLFTHEAFDRYHYRVKEGLLPITTEDLPRSYDRCIPEDFLLKSSIHKICSLLRGLFSANGSCLEGKSSRVVLKTSSIAMVNDITHLLSFVGIPSYYSTNRATTVKHRNGVYESKKSYQICIPQSAFGLFYDRIGFIQKYKTDTLVSKMPLSKGSATCKPDFSNIRSSRKIASTAYIGTERVYDITVDNDSHTLWCNGFNVANCGEATLKPYESCNLGSINLTKFITPDGQIDYIALKKAVRLCVRFLDNVIDVNDYPIPEIGNATVQSRKIGLGIMGFADVLHILQIPYNSEEALELGEEIMWQLGLAAKDASRELGDERGPFPDFGVSKHRDYGPYIRNASSTCIAPTGTISIIAECSSGIEPIHALVYQRRVNDEVYTVIGSRTFYEYATSCDFWGLADTWEEFAKRIIANKGSIQGIKDIPEDVRKVFVVSHDIPYQWHVKMQSAFQEHTGMSISKTVNLPNTATVDDVSKAYNLAYRLGCKGVTVFRDGCRNEQVITYDGSNDSSDDVKKLRPRDRPRTIEGKITKVKTGCGTLYVTVGSDEHGAFEVFTNLGKAGGCPAQSEALARSISLNLRSGVDHKAVFKQICGVRCMSCRSKSAEALSCPDAIGRVVKSAIEGSEFVSKAQKQVDRGYTIGDINCCPECGSVVIMESGCKVCHSCGWSKCG